MKKFFQRHRKLFLIVFVCLVFLWSGWQVAKWGFRELAQRGILQGEQVHAVSFFVNLNELEVATGEGIDRGQIEIFWNGERVFAEGRVLKSNFNKREVRYKYGPQSFGVKYRGKELSKSEDIKFIDYKANNWDCSHYKFDIVQEENGKVAAYFSSDYGHSKIKFTQN